MELKRYAIVAYVLKRVTTELLKAEDVYNAVIHFKTFTSEKAVSKNSQNAKSRNQEGVLLDDVIRVYVLELLIQCMLYVQDGQGELAASILRNAALISCLIPTSDPIYKFAVKYSERIVEAMNKSKACAGVRDLGKSYAKTLRKQTIIDFKFYHNIVPDPLVIEFAEQKKIDLETFDEKEWDGESLSFRYYNLIENYHVMKRVSIFIKLLMNSFLFVQKFIDLLNHVKDARFSDTQIINTHEEYWQIKFNKI